MREGGGMEREQVGRRVRIGTREQEIGRERRRRAMAYLNIKHQLCEHVNKLGLLNKSSLP